MSGKIRSVVDRNGRTCSMARDYRGQVNAVECNGWKTTLTSTPRGFLKDVKYSDGSEINFGYDSDTGLIVGRTDSSAQPVAYKYDQYGRLREIVQATGQRMSWPADFAARQLAEESAAQPGRQGRISLASPSYALLINANSDSPFSSRPAPSSFFLHLTGNNGSISAETLFRTTDSGRFRRSLKVNDSSLFSVELDPVTKDETVLKDDGSPVITTKFDQVGRVTSVKPVVGGDFVESRFTYDDAGRLIKWELGSMGKAMAYSDLGLPVAESSPNGAVVKYEYNEKKMLTTVTKGTKNIHCFY